MNRKAEGEVATVIVFGLIGLFILSLIGGWMVVGPIYRVWSAGKDGEAKLREAESSRQILIQEAKAKLEASKMLADAEIERAKGVAASNKIIGEGLKGSHEYLTYLWIQSLGDKDNHVIYVPTEAGLPILEAGRFAKPIGK